MKPRTIGGIIAAVILGVLLAILAHIGHQIRERMGRDGFLAAEAVRYDKDFGRPDRVGIKILGCILLSGVSFGVYELLAFGVAAAVRGVAGGGKAVPTTASQRDTGAPDETGTR